MNTVTFKINPQQDINVFFGFVNDAKYDEGQGLENGVFKKFPECREWFTDNMFTSDTSLVNKFVASKYAEKNDVFTTSFKEKEKKWRSVEEKFYIMVNELFGNFTWPVGKYIAYSTIWGMFPYDFDEKSFWIPCEKFEKDYTNAVIAHEMLHFAYFANFPEYNPHIPSMKEGYFNMQWWHMSEIFNSVVQNTEKWRKVFEVAPMPYDEHRNLLADLNNRYKTVTKENLHELIRNIKEGVEDSLKLS